MYCEQLQIFAKEFWQRDCHEFQRTEHNIGFIKKIHVNYSLKAHIPSYAKKNFNVWWCILIALEKLKTALKAIPVAELGNLELGVFEIKKLQIKFPKIVS